MGKTIKANGIEINYRLQGKPSAPVIMLSNSLMSNYTMWDDQIDALERHFQILRYDQRGHGGTETTPGPYTTELLAKDALALADRLEIERFHFMGLSMGGFTGQELAIRYPDRILSLVLCDTACIMPPSTLWNERIAMARSKGIESLMPGTLERWFTEPFRKSGNRRIEKIRAMILGTGVEGYIGCAEAIRDMDLCESLPRIVAPTLIVVGESDPACPVSSAEFMHRQISGSRIVVLPDSAHLPNIEQTEAFNKTVSAFLIEQL